MSRTAQSPVRDNNKVKKYRRDTRHESVQRRVVDVFVLVCDDSAVSDVILAVVDVSVGVDIACSVTSDGVRGLPVVMIDVVLVSLLVQLMARVIVVSSLMVSLCD